MALTIGKKLVKNSTNIAYQIYKRSCFKNRADESTGQCFHSDPEKLASDQQSHREMLLRQISSLKFLLRQGLAIRGHEELEGNLLQLLKLRSEDFPDLKGGLKTGSIFLLQF